ncbi:hypothetical protein [Oceanicola sp. S124]|uniref:hypothetical protein n=1 Tax=Oceanicola sp. S124 TaxID=1042378 RepID=UPI00025579CC|nr:hypothetical protein [Oceanicola sp. S124]
MNEIGLNTRLVSASGGSLDIVSADGEILASIDVPPGSVSAMEFQPLLPEGCHFEVSDGLVALNPRHRIGVQRHPLHRETGANPDFQPTTASRFERETRMLIARLQARTERVEARERQLAKVERIPKAKQPHPVIEDDTPAPEPTAEPEGDGVE